MGSLARFATSLALSSCAVRALLSGVGQSMVRGSVRVSAKRHLGGNSGARKVSSKRKKREKEEGEKIVGSEAGLINWYPGHIAKAERTLSSQLKLVDIVIEARDARAAASTAHPRVDDWAGHKPRVVVYTFADSAPAAAIDDWRRRGGLFVDAKRGSGDVRALRSAVRDAGRLVNAKREAKGIRPRPARAAIIGFPNVGKSALINCLCGRRAVKAENKAGVTRQLNWVRAGDGFELLDSPGIIPAKQLDQHAAAKLAMCGDIGSASYDPALVASALLQLIAALPTRYAPRAMEKLADRAGALDGDPLEWLYRLANHRYNGDLTTAANVVLADFRNGRLGPVALEPPPDDDPRNDRVEEDNGEGGVESSTVA